ncbi:uncharacterized protein N7458_007334 [Penicillium daleae]|uniref:GPI anchored glycoprotein n=1 Tax=Penicillium daleae TaxID=63821 RepID=A0AAD6C0E0_9EURO|nr:uncharacterized protein N7458_007334 [Penicillium daleae]KAJ5443462.1 hypothetical protein N7458_007334 [Penicillium daleae]
MFPRLLLALGGVSAAYAQTTADSPFLDQFLILSDYTVSTVESDATHTTYNVKCDSEATLCSLPATGVAVVTGPSYVGLSYTEPSETFTSSVGCNYVDARASAVCVTLLAAPGVGVQSGSPVTTMTTVTSTVTLPAASVELGFNTGVAGAVTATTTTSTRNTTALASSTGTPSLVETATKTGAANEAFKYGNPGLVVGAAMAGLALL